VNPVAPPMTAWSNEIIMMIEHFLLANSSSIDMNTNSLSAFGILDDMQIQAPPGMTLNLTFHAILVVKRMNEEGPIQQNFRMTVLAPDGNRIGQELLMPVAMQPQHRRTRLRVITEVPVSKTGTYVVRMECVDRPMISRDVTLHIEIMPVTMPEPGNPQLQ
jgi:hypothetical protein